MSHVMKVIHEAYVPERQGGDYDVISRRVGEPATRVFIHVDSGYAKQSSAHVDVWTSAGWTTVIRLHGGDEDLKRPKLVDGIVGMQRLASVLREKAFQVTR